MSALVAQNWFKEHSGEFTGQLILDESLARYTYYRIGGPASVLAIPKTLNDLKWLARGIQETGIRFFILGAGSNLLVADEGFPGLVIRVNRLNLELFPLENSRVRTGASVMISMLLRRSAEEGWGGLEFLTGIPGTVGGATCMNAGTHLGEAKDSLRKVEVFPLLGGSGELIEFGPDQLRFEYRKNLFLSEGALIWATEWEFHQDAPATVKAKIDETLARRKSTQPIDLPSCGSVFKNPRESGKSAWQVIDQLGLRGHRIGDAQFAEKHSNFILNLGSAKAEHVRALIELAQSRAKKELGIHLQEEVIYLR